MSRLPLRLRITLASAASTALILGTLSLFVYARLNTELLRATDIGLVARAQAVATGLGQPGFSLADTPDGPDAQPVSVTQILTPDGRVRASLGPATPLLPAALVAKVHDGRVVQLQGRARQPGTRMFVLPVNEGQRLYIVVGTSLSGVNRTMSNLRLLLATADPAALLLACLAAWFLAGAALRPVERMRQEAAAISVSEPGRRLAGSRANDEIARLGETLNFLLDRLEGALNFERRLLDNASHELRTPLSILKAELDLALSRKRAPAELETALRSASEETDRLASLAEDLLVLSRARDEGIRIHRTSTSLREQVEETCAAYRAWAVQHDARIECRAEAIEVMVDPMRLRQALGNLLDNAIRHGAGGLILVKAAAASGLVTVTVENAGPGFAADILPRAFEPFVRGPHEPGGLDGAGLGLPIVLAIAVAHGGQAVAENTPGGARVTLTLGHSPQDPDSGRVPGTAAARD
jgi:two-component system OmpR family sensor kinase